MPIGRRFASEIPGEDPPIVRMHGFADDHRIDEQLLPLLSPQRAVAFDWDGYGRSERSELGEFSSCPHEETTHEPGRRPCDRIPLPTQGRCRYPGRLRCFGEEDWLPLLRSLVGGPTLEDPLSE
jgi:pimeloyl-ACP methyl ester carboxylesterase